MSEGTKRCARCGLDLPVASFHRDPRYKSGLASYCKSCKTAYKREWDKANPDRLRESRQKQRARDPKAFDARGHAWRARNRDKVNAWQRAWRERHPDYQRSWLDQNPDYHKAWEAEKRPYRLRASKDPEGTAAGAKRRRARKLGSAVVPFTKDQLRARLSMFPGCWMCGADAVEVDHVKPLSKGGAHMLCNLRPICTPCNRSKGAKWPWPAANHRPAPWRSRLPASRT
jgi:5-methylcytosine-specific restriction endonuclease McrA